MCKGWIESAEQTCDAVLLCTRIWSLAIVCNAIFQVLVCALHFRQKWRPLRESSHINGTADLKLIVDLERRTIVVGDGPRIATRGGDLTLEPGMIGSFVVLYRRQGKRRAPIAIGGKRRAPIAIGGRAVLEPPGAIPPRKLSG